MHVHGSTLTLDLIGLADNQNRQHVPARQHGINLHRVAIHAANPTPVHSLEFEPVVLPVDVDVVSHGSET